MDKIPPLPNAACTLLPEEYPYQVTDWRDPDEFVQSGIGTVRYRAWCSRQIGEMHLYPGENLEIRKCDKESHKNKIAIFAVKDET